MDGHRPSVVVLCCGVVYGFVWVCVGVDEWWGKEGRGGGEGGGGERGEGRKGGGGGGGGGRGEKRGGDVEGRI